MFSQRKNTCVKFYTYSSVYQILLKKIKIMLISYKGTEGILLRKLYPCYLYASNKKYQIYVRLSLKPIISPISDQSDNASVPSESSFDMCKGLSINDCKKSGISL